ncbi:cell division initiation protein [Streptomyces cinnamoneus]|uniref:Cell division initiation protein n=1 Tax=Streptomyces cinnamoneus TaxID=53446 RepID=A0A2G1XCT2_STRCJ|nr:cell division initiation protein [Streptomyces cinnamoneus]PHQ49046.1 cell division initiation protein [Streptomyces cinnamoneus]PPT15308.1 cell division initiation protein [Streptomyces cinnamoneus]
MDVQKKLDEIVTTVAGARSMPMSASCVINRAELLALLEEVRAALPGSLAQAREVIGDREALVADAREEAERILASARAQRGSLISGTEVARQSREEADRILAEARREAAEIRAEADDYVDSKLANFEVVLTKTLGSVGRGREKLLGLPGADAPDPEGLAADAPERSLDPRLQRDSADAYVDAKLGAVSAVLAKTLEAVGKGREKLLGARPADELGALADQDGPLGRTSDADFLAELAASQEPVATVPQPAQQPAWEDYAAPAADYGAHDPYGYAQQPQQHYPPQADPYAVHSGYAQHDPYAWQTPAGGQGGQGYDTGYAQDPRHQQAQQQAQQVHEPRHGQGGGTSAALDETSFFDTGMIDLDQLRRYEQGR